MGKKNAADDGKRILPLPKWNLPSLFAVAYPLGMLPKAPGTWGSLAGFPLAYGIQQAAIRAPEFRYPIMLALLLLFTAFSLWAIDRTEKHWGTHDDGRIVIDEVLGQAIVSSFFPLDLFHIIAGFILFRAFDIFKPWLVGIADRKLPGAWGTLLDDVIAGIFAALVLLPLSMLIGNRL